jgi:hypothetical protein
LEDPVLRSLLYFAPLALVACVTPTSGDYQFEAVGDVTTDCPDTEDTDTDEPAESDPVGIRVADDGESFKYSGIECSLDGVSFDCETANIVTDYSDPAMGGMDAKTTFLGNMSGKWATSTKITGTMELGSTCEGDDCATLEEYGAVFCSASSDFEANLVE